MTWVPILGLIKEWGPIIAFGALVLKGYQKAKSGVFGWADSLLNNHLTHIQDSVQQASDCLTEMAKTNHELVETIKTMREDFENSQTDNLRVQNAILTGIEVVKAQQA